MAFINDIVINISRGTVSLTEQNFNPIFIDSGASPSGVVGPDNVIVVTELTDLTDAGYLSSDDVYAMTSAAFAQSPRPESIKVGRTSGTFVDFLTELRTKNDDFYAICVDSRLKADLQAIGTWANSNKKVFFGGTSDLTVLTSRNVDREVYLIHNNLAVDFPECSWVGQNIPKQPGSNTWKWKILSGQNASTFTSTQLNTIRTNNGQALQSQAGAIYTNEGIMTSGEYIDVIIGQDWVENQLTVNLLSLFLNNEQISYDDSGIAQVESVIREVLSRAGDNQIIARAVSEADLEKSDDKIYMYQVTVPQRSATSANDRANRILNDVTFIYYLAGAIHKVTVTGKITV